MALSYQITVESMLLSDFVQTPDLLILFTEVDLMIKRIVVKKAKDKSSKCFSLTADYSLRIRLIINETC